MTNNSSKGFKVSLFLGASLVATLGFAAAASAQTTPDTTESVVVTGTLIQGNANLVSPVTTIDQVQLDQRGISTIQDAIQQNVAINGPALTNSFTANGAFAGGASGASLRGLSTNSTLVLFDGMRAAYYPLADDGSRNFVDLNTIPDDIVDRVDVLRDGASSSYGADAIAGVINIITKKEFTGFSARFESGLSQRDDAAEFKLSATAGIGDLATDHVNVYVSAFYVHDDPLYNSERPYPYNSVDGTGICYQGVCGNNGVINGVQTTGAFALSTAGNFMVRPGTHNADGSFTVLPGSAYQNEDGCGNRGTPYTLTAAQQAAALGTDPATVCQYDYAKLGGEIMPAMTRFGVSGHTAFVLPGGTEGWVEANFMQDQVKYASFYGEASTMYGNAPAPIYNAPFTTSAAYNPAANAPGSEVLYLPVYVCPERTNCATAADRRLNPNNPYAAAGNDARIIGRDWINPLPNDESRDRSYRLAGGIKGTLMNDWLWNIGFTAMHTDLTETSNGFVYIQHLLDVINDGTYNFTNPGATPQSVLNYLEPTNVTQASSDEDQVQATLTVPLYKLPAGEVTLVGGTSIAYEGVNAPSGNSDINGPTQRYFVLNAFGTKGGRDVYAAFFELNVPILDNLGFDGSGRYDSYSTGQSNFSPKLGLYYNPWDWLNLKGTYSEGFRIPNFAEANALPTTGYVTNNPAVFNNTFLAQYGCSVATFSTCDAYIRGQTGETSLATPTLKPEKSRSYVFDVTLKPLEGVTLTATYYNIMKTGAITTPSYAAPQIAYYSGQAISAQFTPTFNAPDAAHPNATPTLATLATHFINANKIRTSGFDFGATYDTDLDQVEDWLGVGDALGSVHWFSSAQATYIQSLDTVFPDGSVERYSGTLGNFNLTAGSGTPNWRGILQNTFTAGNYEATGTLNWFSGYNLSAMDQGTDYRDCGLSSGNEPCRVGDAFSFDLNLQAHVTPQTTVYLNIENLFDTLPPIDNVTYGAINYNPIQGGDMILGRYFKLGAKFNL